MSEVLKNPLGYRSIGSLLKSLAIPAIIANVVNALYNIVDQIFIGQGIGFLGNAATNIAFPLTTMCLALGLMTGIGGAARFNLELGREKPIEARKTVGSATVMLLSIGVILWVLIRLFLKPLLTSFGATDQTLKLAMIYTSITSLSIPCLLFSMGMNPIVRADGAARYSMTAIVAGALLNTILDPIFIFGFGWGMAGAASATAISQTVSAIILALYFKRFRSVKLHKSDFKPEWRIITAICSLGMASFIFQSSNVLVQVVTNNVLKTYGTASIYGADIPIAIAGVVAKINVIFIALVIGIVQGAQPILSFNYGAKNYHRVLETIRLALKIVLLISLVFWISFEFFPKQILLIFGSGEPLYYEFGIHYMRAFFTFAILTGVQTFCSTFFPSIGKARIGAIISLFKQVILIVPFLIIFAHLWGVTGVIYAIPVADLLSFLLAGSLLIREYRKIQAQIF